MKRAIFCTLIPIFLAAGCGNSGGGYASGVLTPQTRRIVSLMSAMRSSRVLLTGVDVPASRRATVGRTLFFTVFRHVQPRGASPVPAVRLRLVQGVPPTG